MRISKENWFELWYDNEQSVIDTMVRNMMSDLNVGYDYFGKSITSQRQAIEQRQAGFEAQMDEFKTMEYNKVNRWCYYDLLKRGVIKI